SEVYRSAMLLKKQGYPLYKPQPQEKPYREEGIAIGDVGRITTEGLFEFLFNIFVGADNSINEFCPEGFIPLPPYNPDSRDVSCEILESPAYFSTADVQSDILKDSMLSRFKMNFNCAGTTGAILALPNGAQRQLLERDSQLFQYVVQNAPSWYAHVTGRLDRRLENGDLCLITGHYKTTSWGITSWSTPRLGQESKLSLQAQLDGTSYHWKCVPSGSVPNAAESKSHDEPDKPIDQTVFIRGWSISLGRGLREQILGTTTVEISSLDEFK
ncbi:pleiotropic drug resistance ABC transporter protein, partial [Favolaschia claudopus]